jgi:8-oxo-dGTP diphosphatase
MSAALLTYEGRVLLMKRSGSRTFAPGIWGPVGGHVEPEEINDPQTACLRELEEEMGLKPQDINGLRLRYVLLRREADELRVHYFFSGSARTAAVRNLTDEGELHWLEPATLDVLPMSYTFRAVLRHWLAAPADSEPFAAVTTGEGSEPRVVFLLLTDWRGMENLTNP